MGDVGSIPGLDEALSRALNAHAANRQNGDAAPTLPALLGSIAEDLMSQAQALLGRTGDPVPISVPESDRRMVRSLLALEAHVKALGQDNPSYPQRQVVPVELVNWDSGFPEYSPPAWTLCHSLLALPRVRQPILGVQGRGALGAVQPLRLRQPHAQRHVL